MADQDDETNKRVADAMDRWGSSGVDSALAVDPSTSVDNLVNTPAPEDPHAQAMRQGLAAFDSLIATVAHGVGNEPQADTAVDPVANKAAGGTRTYIGQDGQLVQGSAPNSGFVVAPNARGKPSYQYRIDARAPLAENNNGFGTGKTPDAQWANQFSNSATADRLAAAGIPTQPGRQDMRWASNFPQSPTADRVQAFLTRPSNSTGQTSPVAATNSVVTPLKPLRSPVAPPPRYNPQIDLLTSRAASQIPQAFKAPISIGLRPDDNRKSVLDSTYFEYPF